MPSPNSSDVIIRLARHLIDETTRGKAKWEVVQQYSFGLSASSGSVMIYSRDEDDAPPYVFSLIDPNGVTVESLVSQWEDYDQYDAPSPPMWWNELLTSLYRLARASAYDISGVADAMLGELGLGPLPPDEEPF